MSRFLDLTHPSTQQLEALALRESAPEYYAEFLPIEKGPIVALLILMWVGIAALFAVPFHVVWHSLAKRRQE